MAFAEEGARVTGIDVNERLLSLAKVNLEENHIHAPLLTHDALLARPDFEGAFDLISANDVVEHVRDLTAFLRNLADWLSPDGTAYLEIPNGAYPPFVVRDGHHQLFGITLLEYDQAREYHACRYSDAEYDTFNYLDLPRYREVFASCGLSLTVLPETLDGATVKRVDGHVAELRVAHPAGLESVPADFRGLVADRVDCYLARVEAAPRKTPAERQDFLLRYGAGFWQAIATRIS